MRFFFKNSFIYDLLIYLSLSGKGKTEKAVRCQVGISTHAIESTSIEVAVHTYFKRIFPEFQGGRKEVAGLKHLLPIFVVVILPYFLDGVVPRPAGLTVPSF